MKMKTKLFAAIVTGLLVSAAAGATSTYAWFRTTRTAQVNIANGQIYGNGNLTCTYLARPNNGVTNAQVTDNSKNGFDIAMTANAENMTDISGSGIEGKMYQPEWDPNYPAGTVDDPATTDIDESQVALSIPGRTNSSGTRYYMEFGITFGNKGNSAFNVYLQDGSAISPVTISIPASETSEEQAAREAKQASNDRSAKATRIAFWKGTGENASIISTWQSDLTDGTTYDKYSYVATSAATGAKLYNVEGYAENTLPEATTLLGAPNHLTNSSSTIKNGQLIASCGAMGSATATQDVYVTVWIEGTLSLATAACIGGQITASLNFVAI